MAPSPQKPLKFSVIRRSIAALAVGLAASFSALPAHAEDTVVTLVRPRNPSALTIDATSRLASELQSEGFVVRVVTSTGGDAREEVERADGSFATIAIVEATRGAMADVWIADRITGKTVVRRIDVHDPSRANAASDLAVRSVELLRASLLEIHRRKGPPRDIPAPIVRFTGVTPQVIPTIPSAAPTIPSAASTIPSAASTNPQVAPTISRVVSTNAHGESANGRAGSVENRAGSGHIRVAPDPRFHASIEAGIALLASTQGGPSFRPLIRVSIDLPHQLSARLSAAPSASPTSLAAAQGTVEMRQTVASIDLAYTFCSPDARLRPLVSIGGGVHVLRVDGAANPGFVSQHGQAVSAFVAASAGLNLRITQGLFMLADLSALVLLPPKTVSAVGQPLADLGRPAFLPSVGLVADIR